MTGTTTKRRWSQFVRADPLRRPLLVGLSGVTLGFAGLLFNLYYYLAGALVLVAGGGISALAERYTRPLAGTANRALAASSSNGGSTNDEAGPIWTIPHPVKTFAGRASDLTRLRRQFSRSSASLAVVALHGMPGLGKTQVAMAYAERYRDEFELGWWINASNRLWVVASLAELAERLGVAAAGQEQEQAARAAVAELGRRRGWLLVLDDATEQADLTGLIPNGRGQVLITSRNPAWNTVATTSELPSLGESDAVKLLLTQSGDQDKQAAAAIAKLLQGLPLAIAQAGTYCRFRAVTLADYHARFLSGQTRLLAEGSTGPYPLPVTVTVHLALDQVDRKSIAATQLLRLLAFLGPTAIPHDLPTHSPKALPRKLAAAARDRIALDEAVQVLVSTSLISLDRPGYLRMHNLVQGIIRAQVQHRTSSWGQRVMGTTRALKDESRVWTESRWVDAVGTLLNDAFPGDPGDLQLWGHCAELQPHMNVYVAHTDRLTVNPKTLESISKKFAAYLHDRGEYSAARVHFERALSIGQALLGATHPDALAPLYDLAVLAYRQGEFIQAKIWLRQLVESSQSSQGAEHSSVLKAQLQLSFVLAELGELNEAKQLVTHTLSTYTRTLGPNHLDTLRAKLIIAAPLCELGEVNEAIRHHEEIYEAYKKQLGADHLNTLKSWHNLSRLRSEIGQFDKAKRDLEEILSITIKIYGAQQPFSLYVRHNLARTLWLEGSNLPEARRRFEEVLGAREEAIGADHPKTLTTRHYLARVLAKEGSVSEAERHLRYVADSRQRTLGPDNPHTMLALDDLARLTTTRTISVHGMDAARKFRPDLASSPPE